MSSSAPDLPAGGAEGSTSPAGGSMSRPDQLMKNCWSCRLLTGGGLLAAGTYVFMGARSVIKRGGATTMGLVAQISFAMSLAAWGAVIITDPVGKSHRKT